MVQKYLVYNEYKLFYEINGKGDNALIFIHGLCGNHNVWSKNIPAFTGKYRVLAIDMFGHGNSSKNITPKQAFEEMPSVLQSLIKKESLKNVVLIGHSIAGNILLSCIEKNIIDVLAYVFVDCTFNATGKVVNSRNKLADSLLDHSPHEINHALVDWYKTMMDMHESKEDNGLILSSLKNLDGTWPLAFLKTTNIIRQVPQTKLPVLIFESDWLTKDQPERSFGKVLPHVDYVKFAVSNHFFFVYEANKFNQMLQEFLEKIFRLIR